MNGYMSARETSARRDITERQVESHVLKEEKQVNVSQCPPASPYAPLLPTAPPCFHLHSHTSSL